MSEQWLLVGIALVAFSGIPGLFLGKRSSVGQWLSAALIVAGCGLGLGAAWLAFSAIDGAGGTPPGFSRPWSILPGAAFDISIDGLSIVFLLPIFLVSMLGSVYGLAYWKQAEHPDNGRKLRLFYGLLTAGMALLVVAHNAVLFMVAWEVMALSAFLLVATEDHRPDAREAAWIYLAMTHVGTLLLFVMFALMHMATSSYALDPLPQSMPPALATAIFLLALCGFGIKAGIMPLHIWLPSAHAIAPSHVSALMSGVIIKMGIYGLVRIGWLLPNPPLWWGGLVLSLGVISGVLGVAYAIGQHDLKRLLAYHSIENIGIIVMGMGLAMIGRSLHQPTWIVLGMAGALFHVWNHALFKSLLFLSAGSVIHAVHTREIDELGGLAKAMPYTAACFLVGAVAICGLPPLNGFVSELLIFLGLFSTLGISLGAEPAAAAGGTGASFAAVAFAAPALALIGALAVACFVKVYGAVFLGSPRSEHATHAHESKPAMIGPLVVLALCCTVLGVWPVWAAPVLERAIATIWPRELPAWDTLNVHLTELASLEWISVMAAVLLGSMLALSIVLAMLLARGAATKGVTWDCGYAAPTTRMQYTSSSFAQMLVDMFSWALQPKVRKQSIETCFPEQASFHTDVPDAVLELAILPSIRRASDKLSWFRILQQGSIQAYLLYVFAALMFFLLWR